MGSVGVHTWESGFSGPLKALGFLLPLLEPGSRIMSCLLRNRAESPEARIAIWGGLFMLFRRQDLNPQDPDSVTHLGPSPDAS